MTSTATVDGLRPLFAVHL